MTKELNLDLLEGFEEALIVKKLFFSRKIIISEKEIVISKTKKLQKGLTLWTDDLRTNSGIFGVGITWRTPLKWIEKSISLEELKEIYDVKLFVILEVLKIAVKEREKETYNFLTIFSDLQTTISRILNNELRPEQVLTIEIIKIV